MSHIQFFPFGNEVFSSGFLYIFQRLKAETPLEGAWWMIFSYILGIYSTFTNHTQIFLWKCPSLIVLEPWTLDGLTPTQRQAILFYPI